jgi:hypothetical protein
MDQEKAWYHFILRDDEGQEVREERDLALKEEKGLVMDTARSKATQKNHISEASSKNSIMPEGAAHWLKTFSSSTTSSKTTKRTERSRAEQEVSSGQVEGGRGTYRQRCDSGSVDINFG